MAAMRIVAIDCVTRDARLYSPVEIFFPECRMPVRRKSWLLTICLLSASPSLADDAPRPGSLTPAKLERQIVAELDYLLYLPDDYEQHESWPLLLFLHGAGERGADLELVKVHGPPKLIAAGQEFPMIVVSPQCPERQRWQAVTLGALLDEVVEKYRVDKDRIYVTGLSMGGFGTWALAAYSPDRFAAIAPICGGGETFWTREMLEVPVWAFHGDEDEDVPVERTEQMIAALQRRGAEPRMTIYPGVDHDSWTQTYANPELYEWLLQHRRRRAAEPE
jgi:predicted peptidase